MIFDYASNSQIVQYHCLKTTQKLRPSTYVLVYERIRLGKMNGKEEEVVRRYKLYLAGPEVFLPNALEHAEKQKVICRKFDFIPLHPMDNNLDLGNHDIRTAMRIYLGDIGQIRESNILVANCNGFRGVCMDDGSAYELGYGNALGKISYGYIRELTSLVARVARDYPCPSIGANGVPIDCEGYLVSDDFGTSINLMMQCGMLRSKGRLIEGDFEACIAAIRFDLNTGRLVIA
jgi:nucleoside 2-deoxyribosyltransferase